MIQKFYFAVYCSLIVSSNHSRPSDYTLRPSQVLLSRMETKKIDKKDDIIEQTSISTYDFHSKSPPMSSIKNTNFSEFPDDDFNFDDCDIINKIKESQRFFYPFLCIFILFSIYIYCIYIFIFHSTFFSQQENPLKSKIETCPSSVMPMKLTNNVPMKVEKCTSMKIAQNEKSMV